jgi:mannose-6-phosphate isomerase
VFARAHYCGKVRDSLVESALNAALAIVSTQFARDDGLYEASLAEDWADLGSGPLQNPQMHLAEAFLQVLAVREDASVQQALLQLCDALQAQFIEPQHGLMLEKPRGAVDNWFEPGHQFEWAGLLERWGLARGREDARILARQLYRKGSDHGIDPVQDGLRQLPQLGT